MEQPGDSSKPATRERNQPRRRPIEVKKPNAPYRYPVTSGWLFLHTAIAWVVIGVVYALFFLYEHTNGSFHSTGSYSSGLFGIFALFQGVLFAGYFVSMGRASGMHLGPLITFAAIGALFPFWMSFFFVVPFGLGIGLLLPVGWIFFVCRAFSYRWSRIFIVVPIAALIFGGWTALLIIRALDEYDGFMFSAMLFMDDDQLVLMALIWHLLCSLTCVRGVNERRLVVNKVWREYVRHLPTCPWCRYRFRGLPKSTDNCPECGELIPIWVRNVSSDRPSQAARRRGLNHSHPPPSRSNT